MLAASDFEFRSRFWIFGALFGLGFFSYSVDHQNSGAALVDWIARLRGTAAANWQYHAIFGLAALLCIANAAVRTWGTAYLNAEIMVDSRIHTSRLVADGPYRYVRNPLYFGNILLAIGFGLMASRLGFLILVGGMIVFDYRLILREEAEIVASQGDSYRAYCAAVPRLLPALRPKLPSGEAVPNWTDGFLGEAFMWVLAASVVVFALSLSVWIFYVVLGSAFVIYALCYAVIVRRRRRATADSRESPGPPRQVGRGNSPL
ncbi:MAG TPA: isoprenylcysteine carboxylmethyltransferase family protein [Candidatus Binatia bacterium]|nr:isoprenylcysteine carboxylmethyltransferase family protein [Candidatus Binatia bacterium]